MAQGTPISAILRIALFSAALAGFVFAILLAGAPELHEWAHHDSGDSEHECLATVLHSGTCDKATPTPPLTGITFGRIEVAPAVCPRIAPSLYLSCRILEHAPPAVS